MRRYQYWQPSNIEAEISTLGHYYAIGFAIGGPVNDHMAIDLSHFCGKAIFLCWKAHHRASRSTSRSDKQAIGFPISISATILSETI